MKEVSRLAFDYLLRLTIPKLKFALGKFNARSDKMIHYMKLKDAPFEKIKSGKKTVELRLYDEKRRKICIGDKIIFSNIFDENAKLIVMVKALYICETFKDLFEEISLEECGNLKDMSIEAAVEHMREYYSVEDEQKYGIIGIKIILTDMKV